MMPHSERLSAGMVTVVDGCRWAVAGELVCAAQRVGDPEPACHEMDQLRRVGAGHPSSGDKQRACGGPPQHRYRVDGGAECQLGHADHWDGERLVCIRA